MNPPQVNSQEFIIATNTIKSLKEKPNNDELLQLYSWYKQASMGDNLAKEPSMFNLKEKAKWKSWLEKKGKDVYSSEIEYITLVNKLIKKYGVNKCSY